MTAENHGTQLHRLELIFLRVPRYFVTACTHKRRHILTNPTVHESFLRFARQGAEHGAWVGAHVLMPDHFHAFIAIDDQKLSLSAWAKSLKNVLSGEGSAVIDRRYSYSFAADVWSCTIRHPSGRRLRMSVNRPCGWSFARFSFQRPDATAESADNSVISRSENVSVPIFARLEYFFL
jgi:REP element-mobilizing transposase RayT